MPFEVVLAKLIAVLLAIAAGLLGGEAYFLYRDRHLHRHWYILVAVHGAFIVLAGVFSVAMWSVR
jgi:hypothetical protein